ncbi:MAG: MarR family transcriptional regulator [Armatimonadota bacterium]|nr:MarR family transcriptional regulator [Armatimonadota bacterium]
MVVQTILLGMRTFRTHMRALKPQDLSVPQFRTLAFLSHTDGASLSEAAEHFGLTPPSMSRAIDWLVKRGLVTRESSNEDRRRVTLGLTDKGREVFSSAKRAALARFAESLSRLTPSEQSTVIEAMRLLQSALDV